MYGALWSVLCRCTIALDFKRRSARSECIKREGSVYWHFFSICAVATAPLKYTHLTRLPLAHTLFANNSPWANRFTETHEYFADIRKNRKKRRLRNQKFNRCQRLRLTQSRPTPNIQATTNSHAYTQAPTRVPSHITVPGLSWHLTHGRVCLVT